MWKLGRTKRQIHGEPLKVKKLLDSEKCDPPDKSKFQSPDFQNCDKCDYRTALYYNRHTKEEPVDSNLSPETSDYAILKDENSCIIRNK